VSQLTSDLPVHDDAAWLAWRAQWEIRPDTTYLNHGSFGPPPQPVRQARAAWQARLDEQPMDFLVRQYELAWHAARDRLAGFVHADPADLVFVENATAGMNVVAASLALKPGDEVLLTDHEYGAVLRIWQRACSEAGALPPKIAPLPPFLSDKQEVVDAILSHVNERTRLLVVSHVTSPTAVILPVAEIVAAAHARGVAVCIDGPHAPLQVEVDLGKIHADFYTASCHKWLCGPLGSGFLHVAKPHQSRVRPVQLSWGRVFTEERRTWSDEFVWSGTRDSSAYLAVPAAIDFFAPLGPPLFRRRTHHLAQYARQRLVELTGLPPVVPDDAAWYGSMALAPLPPGERRPLQEALWQQHGIEVPIVEWNQRRFVRVSCHLYNTHEQLDRLVAALHALLAQGR
jgi:isopenicillin-N epimerase